MSLCDPYLEEVHLDICCADPTLEPGGKRIGNSLKHACAQKIANRKRWNPMRKNQRKQKVEGRSNLCKPCPIPGM